jgi:hypothetical protein
MMDGPRTVITPNRAARPRPSIFVGTFALKRSPRPTRLRLSDATRHSRSADEQPTDAMRPVESPACTSLPTIGRSGHSGRDVLNDPGKPK